MANRINFENKTDKVISIVVEPEAVSINLLKGKTIEIELTLKTDEYDGKFTCILEDGQMIIYECRQYQMKIFGENQLECYTPAGRYW